LSSIPFWWTVASLSATFLIDQQADQQDLSALRDRAWMPSTGILFDDISIMIDEKL
jgi:hypothetical protein